MWIKAGMHSWAWNTKDFPAVDLERSREGISIVLAWQVKQLEPTTMSSTELSIDEIHAVSHARTAAAAGNQTAVSSNWLSMAFMTNRSLENRWERREENKQQLEIGAKASKQQQLQRQLLLQAWQPWNAFLECFSQISIRILDRKWFKTRYLKDEDINKMGDKKVDDSKGGKDAQGENIEIDYDKKTEKGEICVKVICLGDSAVGKSK